MVVGSYFYRYHHHRAILLSALALFACAKTSAKPQNRRFQDKMAYQFRPQQKRNPMLELIIFALIWAILIFFSLIVDMLFWNMHIDERGITLITLITISAFITAIIAFWLERLIFSRLATPSRFCAIFMLLTIGTGGASCLAVALYNLPFFTDDIADFPFGRTARDFFYFTMANSYSFAAFTARLFLPLGVVSLFMTAFFYCAISVPRRINNDY